MCLSIIHEKYELIKELIKIPRAWLICNFMYFILKWCDSCKNFQALKYDKYMISIE